MLNESHLVLLLLLLLERSCKCLNPCLLMRYLSVNVYCICYSSVTGAAVVASAAPEEHVNKKLLASAAVNTAAIK